MTFPSRQRLGRDAFSRQLAGEFRTGAQLHKIGENAPHSLGFGFIHHQLAVFDVVTQGREAAYPQTFFLAGGKFIPNPFTRHFPLKLRKGQQNIQRQPPHAGRGIELLRHCDK